MLFLPLRPTDHLLDINIFLVYIYGVSNHEGDCQGCDTNGIIPRFRYQYKYKSVTPKTVYFELEKCLSVNSSPRTQLEISHLPAILLGKTGANQPDRESKN